MKAVSPVIATVIIVAVAIAVSIAVALWISGLVGGFTGVEKLEVVNVYADKGQGNSWTITITVRNTGTKTVEIDGVYINNRYFSIDKFRNYITVNGSASIKPGESTEITITLGEGGITGNQIGVELRSGLPISVAVHTTSGGQYPGQVTLP